MEKKISDMAFYVPCLQWKMGEYLAVSQLSPNILDSVVPLIEVPQIGYDFEKRRLSRDINKHLELFTRRVCINWKDRPCFIDMHRIDASERMANSEHPFIYIFDALRGTGVYAIPVITLQADPLFRQVVGLIIKKDHRGVCLRIDIDEVLDEAFEDKIQILTRNLQVTPELCDFIIDLGAPPGIDKVHDFVGIISRIVSELPHLQRWRSLTILATSFPETLSRQKEGISYLQRYEWILYKMVASELGTNNNRIPNYGDYAIVYPYIKEIDHRKTDSCPSIRYAIDNQWLIIRGKSKRKFGPQYNYLSKILVSLPECLKPDFSKADHQIYKIAGSTSDNGSPTTWVKIGINHHIEKVVRDLANFHAS